MPAEEDDERRPLLAVNVSEQDVSSESHANNSTDSPNDGTRRRWAASGSRNSPGAQEQEHSGDGGNDGRDGGSAHRESAAKGQQTEEHWTAGVEMKTILLLSLPIFVAVCSWLGMKVTDTAVLGHVGTDYLSAASLSDIYTTSTAFLIGGRVLSTFCGQAWGAKNYRLVGIWLNVSLVIVGLLSIPVIVSWNLTRYVLRAFHKTGAINHNASLYSAILSASIPARVSFSQLSAFFQAQQIVRPAVVVAVISFAYNLLMNLFLVLGVGIKGFSGVGFIGCPLVTSSAQYLQIFLLVGIYILWKKMHRKTWFGFHWHEITWARCKRYLKLYLPAILMYGSEFWRFNLIGVLAASLSDTDVAAFNASYKIIYIVHQFAVAIGQATSIRTGIHLGAAEPKRAQYATWLGTALAGFTSLSLAILIFFIPKQVGQIFTSDEDVLNIFHSVRLFLAITIFTMSTSDTMEAILVAQGRTRAVAISTTVVSWGVHVPASFLLVHYWEHSMRGLYLGVALGYVALTLICLGVLLASKWDGLVADALKRSETMHSAEEAGAEDGGREGESVQAGQGEGDEGQQQQQLQPREERKDTDRVVLLSDSEADETGTKHEEQLLLPGDGSQQVAVASPDRPTSAVSISLEASA